MSEPTLEICSFIASKEFIDNPSLSHSGYDLAANAVGLRHLYEGVGVEDESRRWLIFAWDTYEDHKALIDSAIYPEVRKRLNACIGGDSNQHHVVFSDNATIALTAPVTEFGILKLKDLSKKDELVKLVNELIDHNRKVLGNIQEVQYQPFIFGEARGEPGLFYFVAGWESVADHEAASKNPAAGKPFIDDIKPLVEVKMAHAKIREYGLRREHF